MKILGIDPGFGLCGFAVLETSQKNDPKLLTFGVISTTVGTNFSDRLVELADDFQILLDKHQPDIVSVEDLFFANYGISVIQLTQMLSFPSVG